MGAIISAPASELPDRVDRATAARLAGAAFDEARWAAAAGADGCVGRDELLAAGAAAPADAGESATLRFIHVNDIYDLASLPSLATLVRDRSAGADRVVVTCGGDFLAPYLLSGLDHGTGMVDCLNALGCTHCCFGNHECDAPRGAGNGRRAPNRKGSSLGRFPLVPHAALLERIAQFGGVWINSNMPGITEGSPLHPLPEYDVVEVASRSGGHTRRVAVLGLLCDYAQLYRKSAFNGLAAAGGIEPPMDALKRLTGALRDAEKPDAVVAMTHLLDAEDDAICATGLCDAVLGGHDHAVTARASSGVPLAKAGMDATHAVVMDLSWSDARAATPAIRTTVERTADFAPDAEIAARVASHLAKVEAMDEMVLSSVRRVRRCSGKNAAMAAYAARHGDRLPDRDAAIPAKTLVMKYLCRELWKLLPAFDDVDADRSGFLDHDEVKRTYVAALMAVHDDGAPECESEKIAAENMVDQLIACLDTNSDGRVDRREYAAVAHGAH
ncbi:hypothetical protein JL722_2853 [Aureococcus anophagefferens]|nr:hypothetical protein JL722_2853 [Aureococcus anophagefferens]